MMALSTIFSWLLGGAKVFRNFTRKNLRFCVFAFNAYAITFAMVLPVLCNDWAYSHYYFQGWSRSEMEKRALAVNSYHATRAQVYLDLVFQNNSLKFKNALNQSGVDFAIGIVTVPRTYPSKRLDYLTQTFAALHKNIANDREILKKKILFICNTFPFPGNYSELLRFRSSVPIYNRFSSDNITATKMNSFEKEKEDYIFCVNTALSYKPKYVMIIEDDAVAINNLFDVLEHVLNHLVEKKFSGGDLNSNKEQWAYLKLFYPDRWKGYGFEAMRLVELLAIGLLGGAVFFLVGLMCSRRNVGPLSMMFFYITGSIYFVLAAFMIGRPYIIEWRRISKYTYTVVPAPGCCSPAILYAADKAARLSTFLKTVQCKSKYPIDIAMDDFAKQNDYKKYLVEPNIFSHIGMVSSIKSASRYPQHFIYR